MARFVLHGARMLAKRGRVGVRLVVKLGGRVELVCISYPCLAY